MIPPAVTTRGYSPSLSPACSRRMHSRFPNSTGTSSASSVLATPIASHMVPRNTDPISTCLQFLFMRFAARNQRCLLVSGLGVHGSSLYHVVRPAHTYRCRPDIPPHIGESQAERKNVDFQRFSSFVDAVIWMLRKPAYSFPALVNGRVRTPPPQMASTEVAPPSYSQAAPLGPLSVPVHVAASKSSSMPPAAATSSTTREVDALAQGKPSFFTLHYAY